MDAYFTMVEEDLKKFDTTDEAKIQDEELA